MSLDRFWLHIAAQLESLRAAESADDVLRICPPAPGVSVGDGWFGGSGGDDSVLDALYDAGWRAVWIEADYHYAMRSRATGDVITYCEGDIYRGDSRRG